MSDEEQDDAILAAISTADNEKSTNLVLRQAAGQMKVALQSRAAARYEW